MKSFTTQSPRQAVSDPTYGATDNTLYAEMICRRLCGALRGQQRSLWLEAAAGSSLVTTAAVHLLSQRVREVAAPVALVEDAEQRYCALCTQRSHRSGSCSLLTAARMHCSHYSLLTCYITPAAAGFPCGCVHWDAAALYNITAVCDILNVGC